MFESIKERYLKNWVTDQQLNQYVVLGAITEEQAAEIKALKAE